MNHRRVTLSIYGAGTYLGREVARFARAMGHRVVAIVDGALPRKDEPWMHGIQWVSDSPPGSEPWAEEPPAAIIYCDTALWSGTRRRFEQILLRRPTELMEAAESLATPPRFVLRSTVRQPLLPSGFTTHHRRAEALLEATELPATILRFPLLYGPDKPDSVAAMMVVRALGLMTFGDRRHQAFATMRVERAALAALRAALEPDISGVLEPDAIARIGDVMIPQ